MSVEDDYQRAAEERAEQRAEDSHPNQSYRQLAGPVAPAPFVRPPRIPRKSVHVYGESIQVLHRILAVTKQEPARLIRDLLATKEAELIDEGKIQP